MILRKKTSHRTHRLSRPANVHRGQSLVELAIFLPILLMLFSGVIEFGFLLNQYLNLLDGPREAARFATDYNPFIAGGSGSVYDNPQFYSAVAGEAASSINPVVLNATTDDVVISVFSVQNQTAPNAPIIRRYPIAGNMSGESAVDNTSGEWHLYGKGGACNETTDLLCHPSRINEAIVLSRVMGGTGTLAPNTGIVVVELFYSYKQTLALPWITLFVPDPIKVQTFTVMPLPAAEPK